MVSLMSDYFIYLLEKAIIMFCQLQCCKNQLQSIADSHVLDCFRDLNVWVPGFSMA